MAPAPFDPGLGSFNFDPGVVSPVVSTPPRVSGQDALKHVLDHVLCLSNNSSIRYSLKAEGYVKISQVIGMSEHAMTVLFYVARKKEILLALRGFAHFHGAHLGHTLTPADWLTVTADMFAAYQGTCQQNIGSPPMPIQHNHSGNPVPSAGLHTRPWLPPLKEKKNWEKKNWRGQYTVHVPTHKAVGRFVKPVSTVPSSQPSWTQVYESYPDSSMGRGHDCAGHPVMTSPPEALVMSPHHDAYHDAYGESQENKNEETPSVTTCDPTYYALVHESVAIVHHETNGGIAHVDEGLENHHVSDAPMLGLENHKVCDVPMLTTSGGLKTKDEVIGSTLSTPHILAGHSDETPVDMSNVTSRVQDWDLSVLYCDPHKVLQATDDADATEALVAHTEALVVHDYQHGENMDKYVVAPVGSDDDHPTPGDKVLPSAMQFRHIDIVEEGDEPSLGDENQQDIYKYNVVYVDDLAMAILRTAEFTQLIIDKYKLKLTDIGPTSFHLECDLVSNKEDEEGILCLEEPLKEMYGEKFSIKVTSGILERNKHLELHALEFCDMDEVKQYYKSMVDSLQWAVSLGSRNDITLAVMTLSHFRPMPRERHLLLHPIGVVTYFKKMQDIGTKMSRTYEPDDPGIPLVEHAWATSIYGELAVLFPGTVSSPMDKMVILATTVDANLDHDWVTGESAMGIQDSINVTPIGWYSKHQSMIETATYGSEFIAAYAYAEQVTDLHNVTYHLGVPIHGTHLMFEDNRPVVMSLAQPHAMWHKRHTELSSHLVRGAITNEDIIVSYHIPREDLSWGYLQVWQLLEPLTTWQVDTVNIIKHSLSLAKG